MWPVWPKLFHVELWWNHVDMDRNEAPNYVVSCFIRVTQTCKSTADAIDASRLEGWRPSSLGHVVDLNCLVLWSIWIMTFHILGMSSSQLTTSIIFQRGRYTTNQWTIWIGVYMTLIHGLKLHHIGWSFTGWIWMKQSLRFEHYKRDYGRYSL
jgi:hypothetical protein